MANDDKEKRIDAEPESGARNPGASRPKRVLVYYTGGTIGMADKGRGLEPDESAAKALFDRAQAWLLSPGRDGGELEGEAPSSGLYYDFARLFDPTGPILGEATEKLRQGAALRAEDKEKFKPRIGAALSFDYRSSPRPIDSSKADAPEFAEWVRTIRDNFGQYDGFLILHGTDTLAQTAAVMGFAFSGLGKPVVLTGSMLPPEAPGSDALRNLASSMALFETGYDDVGVVFARSLLSPFNLEKISAFSRLAFINPKGYPLGLWRDGRWEIWARPAGSGDDPQNLDGDSPSPMLAMPPDDVEESRQNNALFELKKAVNITGAKKLMRAALSGLIPDRPVSYDPELPPKERLRRLRMDPNLSILTIRPAPAGTMPALERALEQEKLDGALILGYGNGNAPISDAMQRRLRELADQGCALFAVSMVLQGSANASYQVNRALSQAGILNLSAASPETALAGMLVGMSIGLGPRSIAAWIESKAARPLE